MGKQSTRPFETLAIWTNKFGNFDKYFFKFLSNHFLLFIAIVPLIYCKLLSVNFWGFFLQKPLLFRQIQLHFFTSAHWDCPFQML